MNRRKLIIRTVVLTTAAVTGGVLGYRNLEAGRALEESRKPSALPPHVTLDVVSERFDQYGGYEVMLRLSNPTASAIDFMGWSGPPSTPLYTVESWNGTRWEESMSFSCGTGATDIVVPAGGSATFATSHNPRHLPVRVGLHYRKLPGFATSDSLQRVQTERIGAQVREVAELDGPRAVFNE